MKMSPKISGHMRVDMFSGEFRARLDFVAFPSPPSACLSNLTSAGNLSHRLHWTARRVSTTRCFGTR